MKVEIVNRKSQILWLTPWSVWAAVRAAGGAILNLQMAEMHLSSLE